MIEWDHRPLQIIERISGLSFGEIIIICSRKQRWYIAPAVDDQSKISYFKNMIEQEEVEDEREYRQKNAIMVKPGKFYRYIFPEADDAEIKVFAEAYRREFPPEPDIEIELLSGTSLLWAYDESNYKQPKNDSELWDSCMRHESCQSFLNFYVNMNCNLLTALQDGEVVGRAVVWPRVKVGTTIGTFLDRIFAYNSIIAEDMLRHGKNQGWITRNCPFESNIPNTFYLEGETIGHIICVQCPFEPDDNIEWPYLDTFRFLHFNGELSNDSDNLLAEISNTDGNIDMGGYVRDVDGEWIELENDNHIEYRGEIYPLDHPDVVEAMESPWRYYHTIKYNCCWSDVHNNYIFSEEAYLAEDIDDYVFNHEIFQDINGDGCYEENAVFSDLHKEFISSEGKTSYYDPEFGWYDNALVDWITYQDLLTKKEKEVPSYEDKVYTQELDLQDADNLVLYNGEFFHIDSLPEKIVCEVETYVA